MRAVQFLMHRAEPVVVQDMAIAGSGPVERNAPPACLPLLRRQRHEDRGRHLQVLAGAAGALKAALEGGHRHLAQDLGAAERMSEEAVGDLARDLAHHLPHRRQQDRRPRDARSGAGRKFGGISVCE